MALLGAGHFKYWRLPNDPRYTVLWVKLTAAEQIVFLEWCDKSGIELFSHVVTSDYLLPTATPRHALASGEYTAVKADHEAVRKSLEDKDAKSSVTMWYMIETEGSDDHIILMRMKWS